MTDTAGNWAREKAELIYRQAVRDADASNGEVSVKETMTFQIERNLIQSHAAGMLKALSFTRRPNERTYGDLGGWK